MESIFSDKQPILEFLKDPYLLQPKKDPVLQSIYNEYMAGIKFTVRSVKKSINKHQKKFKFLGDSKVISALTLQQEFISHHFL